MAKIMQRYYRLTLSAKAYTLARKRECKPLMGPWVERADGKYDVAVSLATANLLKQLAEPQGENLSDTVMRVLKK